MPVDLSAPVYASFERSLARAKRHAELGNWLEAAAAYAQCAADLERYAGYATMPAVRQGWLDKAAAYRRVAEDLEAGRGTVTEPEPVQSAGDLEEAVLGLIHRAPIGWADIAGLEDTIAAIKGAYGLALAQAPPGVLLEPMRNVLLYGPPGTGKTMLAAAASNGLSATFFNVKASDLLSKYFGESARLVAALYAVARRMAPSVVFLDELESLAGSRDEGASGPEGRIVSSFLSELDGLTQKGGAAPFVLTMAATNLPWLLDGAILSRFERLVFVPLPDEPARRRILELEVERRGIASEVPLAELAAVLDGHSGREIAQIARAALQRMVERCNSGLLDAVDDGREAAERLVLAVQPITAVEWEVAARSVPKRTTPEHVARHIAWREGLS